MVVALMVLVALSAIARGRPPAGDQPGLGMGCARLRLSAAAQPAPDPDESSVLAGALVATAVAVSAYGLYQVEGRAAAASGAIPA